MKLQHVLFANQRVNNTYTIVNKKKITPKTLGSNRITKTGPNNRNASISIVIITKIIINAAMGHAVILDNIGMEWNGMEWNGMEWNV